MIEREKGKDHDNEGKNPKTTYCCQGEEKKQDGNGQEETTCTNREEERGI